jgi:hypothetical protein
MEKIIDLFQSPIQGITFTICAIAFIFGAIFSIVHLIKKLGIKRLTAGGNSVELSEEEKPKEEKPNKPIGSSLRVTIPFTVFKQIIDACDHAYFEYTTRKEDMKEKMMLAQISVQTECVKDAIAYVCNGYENKIDKETYETDTFEILQIYLSKDLNDLILDQLKKLEIEDYTACSDQELDIKSMDISRVVIRDMKIEIKKYPLVDKRILSGIFDLSSDTIKQFINQVLHNMKLNGRKYIETEKKTAEERKIMLENALKNIFDVNE